ncbi:unnamed protein product, partial [Notodromas monacha]
MVNNFLLGRHSFPYEVARINKNRVNTDQVKSEKLFRASPAFHTYESRSSFELGKLFCSILGSTLGLNLGLTVAFSAVGMPMFYKDKDAPFIMEQSARSIFSE